MKHPQESQKIYHYGKVCDADSDNTDSEATYLCEKVGGSELKRDEKVQIVVHKKQIVLCECVKYKIRRFVQNNFLLEKMLA